MRKLLLSAAIWLAIFTFIQIALATPSSGESIAAQRLEEARSAFAEQDWATTADACRALAAENPYQGEFWYRLGVATYYLKEFEESISSYQNGLGIAESLEHVDVTVKVNGKEKSLRISPQPYTHVASHGVIPDGVGMNDGANAKLPLYLKDPRNNYWFEYLADEKMVYFQFNSVRDKDDESIAVFADKLFAFVEANEVDVLVIDVRLNHGGNNYLVDPIIRNTIRSNKINHKGNLYMIIGRETFSACQNFTNRMQARTNVMMVGEATGSRPNFVGEGNSVELPYSGITVNASSLYWQDTRSDDYRVWIAPDLAAETTSEDFRANRDPAMDVIREYLKNLEKESS